MLIENFKKETDQRILVLDGATGTLIQHYGLTEEDFRGDRFINHDKSLKGNNDILSLTRSDIIASIHRQYLLAGADIISTNTFNSNRISQADYKTEDLVTELNRRAAIIARSEADRFMASDNTRKIYVAGSVGPTNRSASFSPKVEDPAFRNIDFDTLVEIYREQMAALAEGGVDLFLIETAFDGLNVKAALEAARQINDTLDHRLPVMISATIAGPSGRLLSGITLEALIVSIASYYDVVSVGLNCSWGATEIRRFIDELSKITDLAVSCHPNAGLPDENGNYSQTAEEFALAVETMMRGGMVNIIGGCCGTTPEHIRLLSRSAKRHSPRKASFLSPILKVAGLEVLEISPASNFVNIGERCNVAGSKKFLRLIKEGDYDEALAIARKQVRDGALILDINMDDAMIDAEKEMVHFLRLVASDPDIAKVPVMIDSSDWNVLVSGLKAIQGKSIANSISLKEGEEDFLRKAKMLHNLGASVVVMAFDEHGQADTYERKIEICNRAYKLLIREAGYNPTDIIFDPNVMAVATGVSQHDSYGCDFIRATAWIKTNLPGAKVSGGVSNLSFAFRGNNILRESMHAVFLYHAIAAGLDMAIVNPATTVTYDEVDNSLRNILDRLFIEGSHEAATELIEYATQVHNNTNTDKTNAYDRSVIPVDQRLREAIVKGHTDYLEDDLNDASEKYDRALDIINGPLMDGVGQVGNLFGEGKMFLPQVVKTARAMKRAVDLLRPRIEAEKKDTATSSAGKILFATVKGDVHDIGKNIVAIVLECNNYEVKDLGVMVPAETIVEEAKKYRPDIICLSGLITPSLAEMVNVAAKLEEANLNIPLVVGGATTSKVHTALKIAPNLSAPVIHALDASQNPLIAAHLLDRTSRKEYISEIYNEYEKIREEHNASPELLGIQAARQHKHLINWEKYSIPIPKRTEIEIFRNIPVSEILPLINWRMFFHFWQLTGNFIDDFPYDRCEHCATQWLARHNANPKAKEALKLYADAMDMIMSVCSGKNISINAVAGIFKAMSTEDDTILINEVTFPMLRRQQPNEEDKCLCVADFIRPESMNGNDYVGAFAVSVNADLLIEQYINEGDKYSEMLLRSLLDRMAEAGSEYLHRYVRRDMWGYAANENLTSAQLLAGEFRGIRPAMGYPMTPDQLLNHEIARLLPFDRIGISLTENGAMTPTSTVTGLYLAHPEAKYFMVGKIGEDQLRDYSIRRNIPEEKMRKILNKNI